MLNKSDSNTELLTKQKRRFEFGQCNMKFIEKKSTPCKYCIAITLNIGGV